MKVHILSFLAFWNQLSGIVNIKNLETNTINYFLFSDNNGIFNRKINDKISCLDNLIKYHWNKQLNKNGLLIAFSYNKKWLIVKYWF